MAKKSFIFRSWICPHIVVFHRLQKKLSVSCFPEDAIEVVFIPVYRCLPLILLPVRRLTDEREIAYFVYPMSQTSITAPRPSAFQK
jgi:hypothetical protein